MLRLTGKVAVITGGASGIGAAAARLFQQEGAAVTVLDLRSADFPVDVRVEEQVREAMRAIGDRSGRIDVLVNAAGVASRDPVQDANEEDWSRVMDVNVKGTFLCSKHALPFMPEGASIVHVSSVTGVTGVRRRAAYSASKGAILSLTRNMALDCANRGIRVNCVCPGFVRTPLIAALTADDERCKALTALHPLGRLGEPEDIARALLFLASDDSSWMTGQALVVDGGFCAGHATEI